MTRLIFYRVLARRLKHRISRFQPVESVLGSSGIVYILPTFAFANSNDRYTRFPSDADDTALKHERESLFFTRHMYNLFVLSLSDIYYIPRVKEFGLRLWSARDDSHSQEKTFGYYGRVRTGM